MSLYLARHHDGNVTVHRDAYYPLTDTYLPAWAEAWGMWDGIDETPNPSVATVDEDPRLYDPSTFHRPWDVGVPMSPHVKLALRRALAK